MVEQKHLASGLEIAIIGMAGRFPGAKNIHEFWDNLRNGVESILFFSEEELKAAGVDAGKLEDPNYVKANGFLPGIEYFDAFFFGYTPKEAEVMDPQMRIFHEVAWTALEDAAYDPMTYHGLIGLYAGASPNFNWEAGSQLSGRSDEIGNFAAFQLTQKDFMSLRISYKFNLAGPSVIVYSACSTSLLALHLACQALLNGECEMALAGGVTALNPVKKGYLYQEGMIYAKDGHCRAFDADATGMLGGDGAGAVVLKRREEAIRDRDHIYAVVKGSAVNNDGIRKAGFTAPSVEGQAEVIKMALQVAEVPPESIGCLETHGTGTPLGDPVEIEGLKLAFNSAKKAFCGIGSVKTNVGHLDAAAGVTGVIKVSLALHYKIMPPTLNFEIPNPKIDFIDSPFYVQSKAAAWESTGYPRRAGVSSLGIGGTNVHVILEEAPGPVISHRSSVTGENRRALAGENKEEREYHLILLAAKTETALEQRTLDLAEHFKKNPGIDMADAAYTLQVGRGAGRYRRMFPCSGVEQAEGILSAPGSPALESSLSREENRPLIFVFPGEEGEAAAPYLDLGSDLYPKEPVFRGHLDHCLGTLGSWSGDGSIKNLFSSGPGPLPPPAVGTGLTSPLVFMIQYALAKLLSQWGIKPYGSVGHGVGRLAAACLAGDLEVTEALKLALAGGPPAGEPLSSQLRPFLKTEHPLFLCFGPALPAGSGPDGLDLLPARPVHLVKNNNPGPSPFYHLLNRLGRLWLEGVTIDWAGYYAAAPRHRLALPTYPFDKLSYCIDADPVKMSMKLLKKKGNLQKTDLGDWFYVPSWKQSLLNAQPGKKTDPGGGWLVFENSLNLGKLLVQELEKKYPRVFRVRAADRFARLEDGLYSLNPRESSHYEALFNDLRAKQRMPANLLHLWNVGGDDDEETTVDSFADAQYPGFFSLLNLVKALGQLQVGGEIRLFLLTDHLQEVNGDERLCPGKAPVLGILKAIPQEFPGISCCHIDIAVPQAGSPGETALTGTLLDEFSTRPGVVEPVIAFRNNRRWVQIFEPFRLQKDPDGYTRLREQGVYLVTGGLGTIGLLFARLLAGKVKAKLILTGRSAFPAKAEWDRWLDAHGESDPLSVKIKKLRDLEALGAEVLYFKVDAADLEQMRAMVALAGETFGEIHGVIHAAGIIEGQTMRALLELSEADCWQQFQGKAYGTLVLEQLFKDKPLDFAWMLSSISCVLAGLGFGAYASANLFMDVQVKKHNREAGPRSPWYTLNWDGMDPETSTTVFERILSLDKPDQLVFSRGGNLQERIDKWIKLEAVRRQDNPEAETRTRLNPRPAISTDYQAPAQPVEKAIAKIWKDLLGYDEIGTHDDFLELGGDSLKSITVISRVHQQLNVNIPLTEFFSQPTIAGLAGYIAAIENKSVYVSIEPAEEKEYYAVSSAQKRLYILQQMDKTNISYNLSKIVELRREFQEDKLAGIFKQLLRRHESLRTSFRLVEGEPVQVVHPEVECRIDYFKVTGVDAPSAEETGASKEVGDIIASVIKPFDLSGSPLLRVGLIDVGATHQVLVVDMHHMISDGVSVMLLVKEFMALNTGKPLGPLKFRYKDYSQWQCGEYIKAKRLQEEEFWLAEFSGEIPVPDLPLDYPRPPVKNPEGNRVNFTLGERETDGLKKLARDENATLYMVLLALLNVLFSKLCHQEDIVLGVGTAGRGSRELDEVIGMFVNTLALRNFPRGEKTFREFLQELKNRTLRAFDHQHYSFEDLVEKISFHRDRSRNPLFDVMFAYNIMDISADFSEVTIKGMNTFMYEYDPKQTKFDLSFIAYDASVTLGFTFEYCTKLFKEETMARFFGYFKEIVSAVMANPEIKLKEIAISHDLLKATLGRSEKDLEGFKF